MNTLILRSIRLLAVSLVGAACGLSGCSKSGGSGTGTVPVTDPSTYVFLNGNWEFRATPAAGTTAPFTVLTGFLNEQGTAGATNFTTAALRAQSSTCYGAVPELSLEGAVQATQVGLTSFAAGGQILTIAQTKDSTSTHLSGTYSIAGGCGDGQHGQLAGTAYTPLTGNYNGPVTGSLLNGMHLTLAQSGGNGDGLFFLTGSATFSGSACFTTANLAFSDGYVTGSTMHLLLKTNETSSSSQVTVDGTINPAADTLTITSISVAGGKCSGAAGTATLKS